MHFKFQDSNEKIIEIFIDDEGNILYSAGGRKAKFHLKDCGEYRYTYADDTKHDVSCILDELWLIVLVGEDRLEFNNNRAQTRRHSPTGELKDETFDIEEIALKKMQSEELYAVIEQLKPSEQSLLRKLYLDRHTLTQAEFAQELGIKESSVKQNAWRIRSKIKKILEEKQKK